MNADRAAALMSELVANGPPSLEQARAALREAEAAADTLGLREGTERDAVVAGWTRKLAWTLRTCPDCKRERVLVAFYARTKGPALLERQTRCRECDNADRAARQAEDMGTRRRAC
jgi:hypothetical protein